MTFFVHLKQYKKNYDRLLYNQNSKNWFNQEMLAKQILNMYSVSFSTSKYYHCQQVPETNIPIPVSNFKRQSGYKYRQSSAYTVL